MAFHITVMPAAEGYQISQHRHVESEHVTDVLRQIGLNFKQSDIFHRVRVAILIEPTDVDAEAQVESLQRQLDAVREAVSA